MIKFSYSKKPLKIFQRFFYVSLQLFFQFDAQIAVKGLLEPG